MIESTCFDAYIMSRTVFLDQDTFFLSQSVDNIHHKTKRQLDNHGKIILNPIKPQFLMVKSSFLTRQVPIPSRSCLAARPWRNWVVKSPRGKRWPPSILAARLQGGQFFALGNGYMKYGIDIMV